MSDFRSFEVIRAVNGGIIVMRRGDPSMMPVFLGAYTNARDFIEALARDLEVDLTSFVTEESGSEFSPEQLKKDMEVLTVRAIV